MQYLQGSLTDDAARHLSSITITQVTHTVFLKVLRDRYQNSLGSRCCLNAGHLKTTLFLVGAFSLKEKSPTLTVSSFFVFFS